MKTHAHDNKIVVRPPVTQLPSAEALGVQGVERRNHYGERETWGKLELALAGGDGELLADAFDSFRATLVEDEASRHKQMEAAVVLTCESLYWMPLWSEKGISETDIEAEVLLEFLANGYIAFPASPGEESSAQRPQWNHDLYLFDPNSHAKVSVQAKLGTARKSNYTHGVRSVSRKAYKSSGKSFFEYLHKQVPEVNEARYKYSARRPVELLAEVQLLDFNSVIC